jgi:uncharacterized membrane protein YeaQ/YmgE (transglycosylase-associated protein family)
MQNALAGFQDYGWLMIIIVGGIAGWIAEKLTRSDMGLIMNILYGILGGVVANFLLGLLGFQFAGFWGTLLGAVLGAVILIVVVRMLRGRRAAV